ncbi:hypothetical protein ACETK8_05150 [Brevundimonas staleyi]|uniref:Lipoprotein n=1 Tax=Brevundimonas staleyi TaxID=74326 RepID=A0ABW0FXJ1_9CAUL
MRALLALAAAVVLAACAPTPPPGPTEDLSVTPGQTPTAAQTAACSAQGGSYSRGGLGGFWNCVILYADADKPCSDASDCRGACLAPPNQTPVRGQAPGRCAASNSQFGCYSRVEKGVVGPGLCVD